MFQQIVIVGTLKSFEQEFKGASAFPIARLGVSTGEKFYDLEATGPQATRVNGVIGDAPAGTPIRVIGHVAFQKGKDGSNWQRLVVDSVAPDTTGVQAAHGVLVGRVLPSEEVARKDGGSFRKASVGVLAADRDGLITDAAIELSFSKSDQERMISDWDANVGAMVELEIEMTAWISEKGRSFPRFNVRKAKFQPWPSYITAFDESPSDGLDFSAAEALSAAI